MSENRSFGSQAVRPKVGTSANSALIRYYLPRLKLSIALFSRKRGNERLVFNFFFFFIVKRAGRHFGFLKRAGHHQKGTGCCALQKRPLSRTLAYFTMATRTHTILTSLCLTKLWKYQITKSTLEVNFLKKNVSIKMMFRSSGSILFLCFAGSENFLNLCKIKYYNFCLFHSVQVSRSA